MHELPAEPFEDETARPKVAALGPRALAGLLATYCTRFVALYGAEGEPSDAPEDAVAQLVARAEGSEPAASRTAATLAELEELLEVFIEREDLLNVHALATFKYALLATAPETSPEIRAHEAMRALRAGISAIGDFAYYRSGTDAWVYDERLWIMRAIAAVGVNGAPTDAAKAVAPVVPLWKRAREASEAL